MSDCLASLIREYLQEVSRVSPSPETTPAEEPPARRERGRRAARDAGAPDRWRLSSRWARESETATGVVLIRLVNGAQHEVVAQSFGAAARRLKVPPSSILRFAWSRPPADLVQLPPLPERSAASRPQGSSVKTRPARLRPADFSTDCTINCALW
jgi:hypothetical protein